MKKYLLLFVLALTVSISMDAQKIYVWFDAGVKGMYGGSSLLNNAAIDHNDLDYYLTFGNSYSVGGKFGINRGYNGLAVEVMYNNAKHKFEHTKGSFNPEMQWESYDLYTLFRNAQNLGFFEIGPKFSKYNKFSRSDSKGELVQMDDIADYGISGVVSFGMNLFGQRDGAMSGQLGLRIEYGLTDIMNEAAQDRGEPLPHVEDLFADGYKKTSPIFAGLVFELNWGLGYYGKSSCQNKAKLFSF